MQEDVKGSNARSDGEIKRVKLERERRWQFPARTTRVRLEEHARSHRA